MTELYAVPTEGIHDKLKSLLSRHIPAPFDILRTENGKPYIENDPVFFSLSHSGEKGLIAISDRPVGVDLEVEKSRSLLHVLSRFSERERAEISSDRDFLLHWTAREAFIKMKGATLAQCFGKLEYFGGKIYICGEEQNCKIAAHILSYGVASVCRE